MINRLFTLFKPSPADAEPASFAIHEAGISERPAAVHEFNPRARAFVPECYEERYAYPLVVWLMSRSEGTEQFRERMSAVSSRNFLGLALNVGTGAAIELTSQRLGDVRRQVTALRKTWHVHTERIFLAGYDDTSSLAVRLFLTRPEWFGGVATLGGRLCESPAIPFRNPGLRAKRLFLTSMQSRNAASLTTVGRTLHAAGLEVTSRHYNDSDALAPNVARDLNSWLIEGLCVPA